MVSRVKVKTTRQKGRGVFANCRIRRGEIIEIAPVIVLSRREASLFKKLRRLCSFCYCWGASGNQTAFVLGFGALYNHSYSPNADHNPLTKRNTMVFRALRDIAPGEEITHNYNGSPNDKSPIRFTKNGWECM